MPASVSQWLYTGRHFRHVEHHTEVATIHEAPSHVGAHRSQPHHPELHLFALLSYGVAAALLRCAMAARIPSMASVTPALAPKIQEPVTKTLAPAAGANGAVCLIDAPVYFHFAQWVRVFDPSADTCNPGERSVQDVLIGAAIDVLGTKRPSMTST